MRTSIKSLIGGSFASVKNNFFKFQAPSQQYLCTSIVPLQHTQRWHTHPEVDAGEETAAHAAVSVADEVVTEEDEEDFQEAVVEVSFTSSRSSYLQEIEARSREIPCLRLRKSCKAKSS
jgi:hypothetical protein